MPDGPDLLARICVASVGRVPLLLLDSDVEEQPRSTTATSPTGCTAATPSTACARSCCSASAASGRCASYSRITGAPEPEVFHTNEGHAGFLGIERIRELTVGEGGPGLDFDTALEVARAGTVFTTHTPVPAGIDRFPRDARRAVLRRRSAPTPGVPVERVLALGAEDYDGGDAGVFNMAVMGFRLAQRANGVSELHGEVSRGMFNGLWPAFDEAEVPIGSITNGVHAPTWVAREIFELAAERGADVDADDTDGFWAAVDTDRRRRRLGGQAHAARAAGRRTRARGCASPGLKRGCAPGRARLDRHRARPRRADDRLRAPRAVVQAADADAARPRAPQAAAARTPSARSSWSSPASRTRPTTAARS